MASNMGGYLGILKWSLNYHDGTSPSPANTMDDATKKWLQECIDSISLDPLDEVKVLLKVLEIETEDQPTESKQQVLDKKNQALQDIGEYLEDLNLANDFLSLQGLQIMSRLLDDEYAAIRSGAAGVVAAVVQNFEKTQNTALEIGLLDKLVKSLRDRVSQETPGKESDADDDSASEASVDGSDPHEKLKYVLAISCLVRGNKRGTLEFLNKLNGFDLMTAVLRTSFSEPAEVSSRLQQKTLFFLDFLLSERLPAFTKLMDAKAFYGVVIDAINVDDVTVRERVLNLLLHVADNALARQHMGEDVRSGLLESLGHLIERLVADEENADYVRDVKLLAESVVQALNTPPKTQVNAGETNTTSSDAPVLLLKD